MRKLITAAVFLLSSLQAQAQVTGVPPEELENYSRLDGDTMHVCFDVTSHGRAFDQDIAMAIGEALFLKVEIHEGFGGFPVSGDGMMDEVTIAMNNSCDLFMGVSVSSNAPVSEAFTLTRPYATFPFVTVVANPDWNSLNDIPKDQRIGTAMASIGEMNYITWAQQRPKSERWVRLPYPNFDLMTTRLLDGTISGMILWAPAFARIQAARPEARALRIVADDPVPSSVTHVGAVASSRNNFLRNQVDLAIDALVADGTIQKLIEKHGLTGHAGE